jgi:peptide/nickel transport system substrate-binding protein
MRWLGLALLTCMALAACIPARGVDRAMDREQAAAASEARRSLTIATRVEPAFLAAKPLRQSGLTLGSTIRIFNAGLIIQDDRDRALPYLAASLPQLDSESWQVFPDGRMETTYRLKANLTFHDGQPLTSEDFAFSWRVYTTPEFGVASSAPQGIIDDVLAPDAQTLVIQWRRPYPKAGELPYSGLPPLPRHALETKLQQSSPDAFAGDAFWSTEYVGSGPYKLERWEPGAFIEAAAFDGHAGGRPRIDRLKIIFTNDANAALASLLSESVHLLTDDAIYFQQAVIVRREMEARGTGRVLVRPGLWRFIQVQLHPDRVAPTARALGDVRVRKGLAYGIDKQAINDAIYEGEGINSDTVIPPIVDYYAEIDRSIVKYPFDPRRSVQLMEEANLVKGPDGFFTHSTTGRLSFELKVIQNPQNESEQAIIGAAWRSIGFDVREAVLPVAQAQDAQVRATFEGLFTTGGPIGEDQFTNLARTPRPENRWTGTNRGSWTNAEFERLAETYEMTLDRGARIRQVVAMARILSDELPSIAINFNPGITAFVGALQGPLPTAVDASPLWNIHEWDLR